MNMTLRDYSLSLQQAVNAATDARDNEVVKNQLNQLSGVLQNLHSAKTTVNEINGLVRNELETTASPVVTAPIDDLVQEMWLKFCQNDFAAIPHHDPRALEAQILRDAFRAGESSWEKFLDVKLLHVDLAIALPNEAMLLMIDPKLKIPHSTSTKRQQLEHLKSRTFRALWEDCGGTEKQFVEGRIKTLLDLIADYTSAINPILSAVAALPRAVKTTLENALSAGGAILSSLDEPEMVAWMKNNPNAKNYLVVRFKETN
jgi:hypothetical protein